MLFTTPLCTSVCTRPLSIKVIRGFRAIVLTLTLFGVAACGGGSGSSTNLSNTSSASSSSAGWVAGTFKPSSDFYAQCATPRSGINPYTDQPYPDAQGSMLDENNWLRSWSNELYLWYAEIMDRNPALYNTEEYFELLKTNAITDSGAPKDQFHWSAPTDQYMALTQSGVSAGYGVTWAVISGLPPREVVVAFTEPNSPATAPTANLARGARVLQVDGVDLVNDNTAAGVNALNAGLFPSEEGETHTFVVQDLGSDSSRTLTLVSAAITVEPVQNVSVIARDDAIIGYILFNSHIATAEAALIDAVEELRQSGASELVLDLRYNGGGYLDIASQLAYMIAGPAATDGQTFEALEFNDKYPGYDPVMGTTLTPLGFHSTTQGFSAAEGTSLPTLNLNRVFVLTGPNTCSASEAIINGLRGINVEVIQIGANTCGKPYGAYVFDNCGTSYFSIQFRGKNAAGYGDYADGFYPGSGASSDPAALPGCVVPDDYAHALGDESEARLAAALAYRESGSCLSLNATGLGKTANFQLRDGLVRHRPGTGDRLLRR